MRSHHIMSTSSVVLLLLTVTLTGACSSENPERQQVYVRPGGPAVQTVSIRFDADDRRDRAELLPEETLVVRLESRGGPGYQWELARDADEQRTVEVVSEPRVAPPVAGSAAPPPQEPKWDVFTFRALRPGTVRLKFDHLRLASPDAPADKHAEVRVEVRSK
jgi:hypothetical protein